MQILIDDQELKDALKRLAEHASDLTPVMQEIGNLLQNETELSFERQRSPAGRPWTPAKKKRGLTLIDSGRLSHSFGYDAAKDSVAMGTNLVYAPIHHFGGRAGRGKRTVLPARPFMPVEDGSLTDATKEAILEMMADYLAGS